MLTSSSEDNKLGPRPSLFVLTEPIVLHTPDFGSVVLELFSMTISKLTAGFPLAVSKTCVVMGPMTYRFTNNQLSLENLAIENYQNIEIRKLSTPNKTTKVMIT